LLKTTGLCLQILLITQLVAVFFFDINHLYVFINIAHTYILPDKAFASLHSFCGRQRKERDSRAKNVRLWKAALANIDNHLPIIDSSSWLAASRSCSKTLIRWTIQPRAIPHHPTKREENTRASWFITSLLERSKKSWDVRWHLMVITISMRLQYVLLYETIPRFSPRQGHEMETRVSNRTFSQYPWRTAYCAVHLRIRYNGCNLFRWFVDCSTM